MDLNVLQHYGSNCIRGLSSTRTTAVICTFSHASCSNTGGYVDGALLSPQHQSRKFTCYVTLHLFDSFLLILSCSGTTELVIQEGTGSFVISFLERRRGVSWTLVLYNACVLRPWLGNSRSLRKIKRSGEDSTTVTTHRCIISCFMRGGLRLLDLISS